MRGSPGSHSHELTGSGSIPACAGEPAEPGTKLRFSTVYPRVCGGAVARHGKAIVDAGLSPRVRGSLDLRLERRLGHGSIPACAGEPEPNRTHPLSGTVYPRVCGGARWHLRQIDDGAGLSPRVRGEPPLISSITLIPRVYPRVCGGAAIIFSGGPAPQGLSPRVRGSPAIVSYYVGHKGSIPACAGEPLKAPPDRPWRMVYPRVCGGAGTSSGCRTTERGLSPRVRGSLIWSSTRFHVPGLSPRVRGSHLSPKLVGFSQGSIPACAGEPSLRNRSRPASRVYPRVCGGAGRVGRAEPWPAGLSPRVRGSRWRCRWHRAPWGSIPACAGEPSWGT